MKYQRPKATRRGGKYPAIVSDKVVALLAYYHRRAIGHEYSREEMADVFSRLLPFGSITEARYAMPGDAPEGPNAPAWAAGDDPRVALGIKDRGLRYYDTEWPMANMVLTIYGNFPHIDNSTNKEDPDQHHYLEAIGGDVGLSALRLIANAQPGQDVKITGEHHDQRMQALMLMPGPGRSYRGRPEAEEEALKRYDVAAEKDKALGLAREEYRALIKAAFKLLDDCHKHKLRRRQDLAPA